MLQPPKRWRYEQASQRRPFSRPFSQVVVPGIITFVAFYLVGIPFGVSVAFTGPRLGLVGLWMGLDVGMVTMVAGLLVYLFAVIDWEQASRQARERALGDMHIHMTCTWQAHAHDMHMHMHMTCTWHAHDMHMAGARASARRVEHEQRRRAGGGRRQRAQP